MLCLFWVQCLTVYSQDVSNPCLPCREPVCHAPPSNTRLVWEAASFPTSSVPLSLLLERVATQGLSTFWKFSGLQVLSPVLACNPKKWLLWRLTLDFLATTSAVYELKTTHFKVSYWSDRLFHPVLCHCQIRKLNSSLLTMFPWVQKEIQSVHS